MSTQETQNLNPTTSHPEELSDDVLDSIVGGLSPLVGSFLDPSIIVRPWDPYGYDPATGLINPIPNVQA